RVCLQGRKLTGISISASLPKPIQGRWQNHHLPEELEVDAEQHYPRDLSPLRHKSLCCLQEVPITQSVVPEKRLLLSICAPRRTALPITIVHRRATPGIVAAVLTGEGIVVRRRHPGL